MLTATVAQKLMLAVSDGKKTFQNSAFVSLGGRERTVPNPPADA